MRQILLGILLSLLSGLTHAQNTTPPGTLIESQPYKGTFHSSEHGVTIVLNLYDEDVIVPGYGFLGLTNGYMKGDSNKHLYGVWIMTSFEIKQGYALLRFSNDLGSESQTVSFTLQPDGTFRYRTISGNEVRKSTGKKLVKIASDMTFVRH